MANTVGEGGSVVRGPITSSYRQPSGFPYSGAGRYTPPKPSRSSQRKSTKQPVRKSSGGSGSSNRRPSRANPSRPQTPVQSYRSSGRSVGNNAAGQVAKTSTPPPMTQGQFLAQDSVLKGQQAAYQKALSDYATQYAAEQQKYGTEYTSAVDKLGLERTEGAEALKDDYAGRGLLQSGVYADALGDFNTDYDTRLADLGRAKENYMNDLLTGKTNFEEEQKLMLAKAQQDAINRYMTSIGV